MSASQHTPGPWTVEADIRVEAATRFSPRVEHLAGWNIASASGEIVGCEGILGDGEANARLIAAAPDLFDAAYGALEVLMGCVASAGGCDDDKAISHARDALQAALTKAKGL